MTRVKRPVYVRNRLHTSLAWLWICIACIGCKSTTSESEPPRAEAPSGGAPLESPASGLTLTSPAFSAMGSIPKKYTCEGSDTSPPLTWSGVPARAKSLALVVDDPDVPDPAAPVRTFVHWVVYNLPPDSTGLAEGAAASGLPNGAISGKNDWGKATFGGSCPPIGRHRYFHKLYALDRLLDLGAATKADLEGAMRGHLVGKAELVGTYQKGQ